MVIPFSLYQWKGTLLQPHGQITWLIPSIAFSAVLIPAIIKIIINSNGVVMLDLVSSETMTWIPIFLSGWTAMWGTSVAYIIQRNKMDTDQPKIVKFLFSPIFVNTVAIFTPLAYTISALFLGFMASKHYRNAIGLFQAIDSQFAIGELKVNNGAAFSILDLGSSSVLESELLVEFDTFTFWFGRYFITQASFASFLLVLLAIFTFLTLSSLRQTIKLSDQVRKEIKSANKDGMSEGFDGRDQYGFLRKLYYVSFSTEKFSSVMRSDYICLLIMFFLPFH